VGVEGVRGVAIKEEEEEQETDWLMERSRRAAATSASSLSKFTVNPWLFLATNGEAGKGKSVAIRVYYVNQLKGS
jgi:hypothetical protein